MEVRDLIKQGATRVIVPTGGIEQNGPFVALNKHDLITRVVVRRTAEILGNTLVSPVVSFVPEGPIVPPSGHMLFPGTISLSEATFVALLHDIGSSLITHGFKEIIFLGDSGDSQSGMKRAAEELAKERGNVASVRFVPEFYDYDAVRSMLRSRGFPLTEESFHEELPFTLQVLAIDPHAVRYDERKKAGLVMLNGTSLADRERMTALGREIIEFRARETAKVIETRTH
jgi:creatinine amidohydrolase/Fe(II)-dependent formamide hydrolase-like protein